MAATPGKYFIGGLNPSTTTDTLRQYFEIFGALSDVVVMVKGGRSRCFGFVTYAEPATLPLDFVSQVHIVDGKQVDVKEAVPDAQPAVCKLFVGGLTATTTTQQLQDYFSQFGLLTDAVAMIVGGVHRGFGFVTFSTSEEADVCLGYPSHVIDGKVVDVKRAEPKGSPALMQPGFGAYGMPAMAFRGGFAPQHVPRAFGAPAARFDTAKVFVGGLTPETTEDSLLLYFSQFGTIQQCEIMRRDGLSRGFGFVVFASPAEAKRAIAPHFHIIDGKQAEVKACLPKEVAPPPQRALSGAFGGGFAGNLQSNFGGFVPRVPRAARMVGVRPYQPRAPFVPRYRPY